LDQPLRDPMLVIRRRMHQLGLLQSEFISFSLIGFNCAADKPNRR
jgi:hypothetical protein